MLNHKYLILDFSTGGHPLRRLLVVLSELNDTKMVRDYDYPLEALSHVPNVNDVVEQCQCQRSVTSRFESTLIFLLMVRRSERVLVLVFIILVVLSPVFVLECLFQRCQRLI
jgi:hypothetical protein